MGSNHRPADYIPPRLSPPRRFAGWTIPSPWPWRAGLGRLQLHDLRHTYGTMASLHGLSLREVADLLGHKSTVSTMRYVNAAKWKQKGNAEAVAQLFT